MKKNNWIGWVTGSILVIVAAISMAEVINDYKNRSWDGNSRFTVIDLKENADDIRIYSVDPQTRQAVVLILPGVMEISTVGGRGVWKTAAIRELAIKNGFQWAGDSIADFLGIPYTMVKQAAGIWDKLAWRRVSTGVDWKEINLQDTSWISESKDPDGARVLELSEIGKKRLGGLFYSTGLAKEGLQITVFNTIGRPGLGTRFARVLENAGLKVVSISQKEPEVTECLLYTNTNYHQNKAIIWLLRTFKCRWDSDENLRDKEITILVGKAYWEWLAGS